MTWYIELYFRTFFMCYVRYMIYPQVYLHILWCMNSINVARKRIVISTNQIDCVPRTLPSTSSIAISYKLSGKFVLHDWRALWYFYQK